MGAAWEPSLSVLLSDTLLILEELLVGRRARGRAEALFEGSGGRGGGAGGGANGTGCSTSITSSGFFPCSDISNTEALNRGIRALIQTFSNGCE